MSGAAVASELIHAHREKLIAQEDAELLRKYRKFLMKHHLKEKLWCNACEDRGDHPGVRANVTDGKIDIACRCTTRRYRGQTF